MHQKGQSATLLDSALYLAGRGPVHNLYAARDAAVRPESAAVHATQQPAGRAGDDARSRARRHSRCQRCHEEAGEGPRARLRRRPQAACLRACPACPPAKVRRLISCLLPFPLMGDPRGPLLPTLPLPHQCCLAAFLCLVAHHYAFHA